MQVDGAADRVDDAGKFRQDAVAHQLDDAAVVARRQGFDQFRQMRLQRRMRSCLVRRHQGGIADDIGRENGGQAAAYAGLVHDLEYAAEASNVEPA